MHLLADQLEHHLVQTVPHYRRERERKEKRIFDQKQENTLGGGNDAPLQASTRRPGVPGLAKQR